MMQRTGFRRLLSTAPKLARTPLYDAHVELGGTMVPYAGFEMPVMYAGQLHIDSHNWVRNKCGLFDVSHMLQHRLSGKDARAFLETITPIDLSLVPNNSSSLTVLLNNEGGVIDDCIITKLGEDQFYMVTNAGCRAKDIAFINSEKQKFGDVKHLTFESTLLAIQGPEASRILQKFTNKDLKKLSFGQRLTTDLGLGALGLKDVLVARTGYTGEDGFELSIELPQAIDFFRALLQDYASDVRAIGLAARDSLRLEAGMCLYGHELTEEITPVEASLAWLIPKTRREGDGSLQVAGPFNGALKILAQLRDKSLFSSRRVGFTTKGPSPRDGFEIFGKDGAKVGYVTSGSPLPTLGGNVAQGYLDKSVKIGEPVQILIRGKLRPAQVSKMPFVPSNLYRGV